MKLRIKEGKSTMAASPKKAASPKVEGSRFDLMEYIIPQKELLKLEDILGEDEQSWKLAVEVYRKIADKLQLSQSEMNALKRLQGAVHQGKGWKPDLHRNNIFKAAHELGIKLPSHMF